jgi:peptide/nickel transport system permease protein
MTRRLAWSVLVALAVGALGAGWVAPHEPRAQFDQRSYAPPMRVHVRDASGWHAPFVYKQVMRDRLSRTFDVDRSARVPIRWFTDGRLMSIDAGAGPLLLLGADSLGRDVWSRLVHGAQLSLGAAAAGALMALLIGAVLGALAGATPGIVDTLVSGVADLVIALPSVYLILILRVLMPLVLDTSTVFVMLAILFAVAGWPHVARGVRAIVATERRRDYAEAARAAGAGRWRVLTHLVPASFGFLRVELVLLIPAFLVAESTISFLGLGFPEPVPSWGLMLRDAASISVMQLAPWLLSPAAALFLVVLALQHVAGTSGVDTISTRR